MGKLLLSLSCEKALSPARRMDRTKALVASRQAMEELGLEALSHETAAGRGVQAGLPPLTDTVSSDCESPFMKAGCGKPARPVVCPAKAGMFSRGKACRGKNQRPRSLDSRVAGNQDSEAYRQRLPGEPTSHRAVTTVNAKVASKVSSPEGRARNRRAKAAWGAEI